MLPAIGQALGGCAARACREPALRSRLFRAEFGSVLMTGEKPVGPAMVVVPGTVVVVVAVLVSVLVMVCVGRVVNAVEVVVTLEVKVS